MLAVGLLLFARPAGTTPTELHVIVALSSSKGLTTKVVLAATSQAFLVEQQPL
jgi:hypothetical protein